jgi:DNA-binding transcriptional MerR regulator
MNYLRKQIAKQTGINAETLRFYEKSGLLPVPERTEKGYRLYNEETIKRLELIKHAKACGLTLNEIRETIEILSSDNIDYDSVNQFIGKKIGEIDSRISELNGMKTILNKVKSNIDNHVKCPVKSTFLNQEFS